NSGDTIPAYRTSCSTRQAIDAYESKPRPSHVLIPKGGDNRLFRKASGLCYFAGLEAQSHATSIGCLVDRSLSHLRDIFIHGCGHATMIRYFADIGKWLQ